MATDDVERRRAEEARQKENSARLAVAYGVYQSTGQGSKEFNKRVDFGLTFIEKPIVSYGSTVDLDELADLLDVDPKDTPAMPITSGYVTEWDTDEKGFYVGAWVGCRVYFPPSVPAVAADVAVRCEHHFLFTAIAMKDIPLDQTD